MGRCSCNTDCNCTITAGDCTSVSGSGSPADPFIVEVVVDGTSIMCTPNGLQATLFTLDTNTVDLTGDGTAANPLMADVILTPDGNVPDPNALGTGNLIKLGPTGIYVSCEDIQDCVGAAISQIAVSDCLEYVDATNTINVLICGEPNGLECAGPGVVPGCPAGGLSVIPSADPNNGLVFGTDNRLFAESSGILAGNCMIITGTGTPGDPFVVTPQVAPEPNGLECIPGVGLAVIPSSDANNGLIFGTDNRLYVDRCPFLVAAAELRFGDAGPCFEMIGDGCNVPLQAILRISDDDCNGLECRADGLYVEGDPTPTPDPVVDFATTPGGLPGIGFFNGTGNAVVAGPTCITITNPSACRDLVTTVLLTGFTDVGRTNGRMRADYEIAPTAGGPWTSVHRNEQAEPLPPSRQTQNANFQGNDIIVPPGGSRDVCVRITVSFTAVQDGGLFFSLRFLSLTGRWAN